MKNIILSVVVLSSFGFSCPEGDSKCKAEFKQCKELHLKYADKVFKCLTRAESAKEIQLCHQEEKKPLDCKKD